uniref:OSDLa n=1 Tax=Dianthus caryophyllus TaxID=3570 RepID=A0A221LEJ6_DIACA|nr:OSDLa [Dianthus caryophyllus]
MPVSRDRLSRPVDISSLLPNAQRRVNLVVDEPGLRLRGLSSLNASISKPSGSASRLRRRSSQYRARLRQQRYLARLPPDQENRTPVGLRNVQGRRSVLPSWHPRTPLRDITAIARAIERRRAELQEQRRETSVPESSAASSSQPENETNIPTPTPTIPVKILDSDVKDEIAGDSESMTPEKRLLNSIDTVRQVWVEEQEKVEKTPAAKKAERDRKVRTLMSMR